MYYFIAIETKKINGKAREIIKLDLTEEQFEKFKEDFIYPYVKGEEFIIDGYTLNKSTIERFFIGSLHITSDEWSKTESDFNEFGPVLPVNPKLIMQSKDLTDITNKFISPISPSQGIKTNKRLKKFISNKVFIVHGHDEHLKYEVAHFLETYGLIPVILHEQANKGQTIIQKLQDNVSEAVFAIVLYSPDDEGRKAPVDEKERKKNSGLQPRARQNVIFEHGLLIGVLGNERVCALVKGEIEKPSDLAGVVYIPYAGNWETAVLKEIKEAGLEVKF